MDLKGTAESNAMMINGAVSWGDSLLSLHSLTGSVTIGSVGGEHSHVCDSFFPLYLARYVFLVVDPNFGSIFCFEWRPYHLLSLICLSLFSADYKIKGNDL